jgi:hypothetical protein
MISEPVWLKGGWTTVICCTKGCWWDGKGVWRGRGKKEGVVARLIRELGRGQLTTEWHRHQDGELKAGEIDLELVPNLANLGSAVSLANRLLPHTSFSLSLLYGPRAVCFIILIAMPPLSKPSAIYNARTLKLANVLKHHQKQLSYTLSPSDNFITTSGAHLVLVFGREPIPKHPSLFNTRSNFQSAH